MAKSRQTGDLVSGSNLFVDTANDRVGIGLTNPTTTLSIGGTVSSSSGFVSNGDLILGCDYNQNNAGGDSIIFRERGNERVRITGSGSVGIGTTNPLYLVDAVTFDQVATRIRQVSTSSNVGPILMLMKDSSSPTAGDALGAYYFTGRDSGGSLQSYAYITAEIIDPTAGSEDGALRFHTLSGGSVLGERMRITNEGYIGIGDTSPTVPLTLAKDSTWSFVGTSVAVAAFGNSALNRGIGITYDVTGITGGFYSFGSNSSLVFYTPTGSTYAERMRIGSTGTITAAGIYGQVISGTTRDIYARNDGVLGYISSTEASKGNINVLSDVDWLYQLQPKTFNYRVQDESGAFTDDLHSELEYGLIAEEVESIAPDLCFYDETDNGQELRGVSYRKLITPLLAALQQANQRIETLEAEVAALKAQ